MAYLKIIDSSCEWVCPADGDYKVICVGHGGESSITNGIFVGKSGEIAMGVYAFSTGDKVNCTISHQSSDFGSKLKAKNGNNEEIKSIPQNSTYLIGGYGGYTLDGVFGGCGAFCAVAGEETVLTVSSSASKNGGAPGCCGIGWGAGGGVSNSVQSEGNDGVIIISGI